MGPAAQRFGEWASAARTFSAITDLIAVVWREADILFVFILLSMHACSTSSCLPAEIVDAAATFSPSRHHHQTWRWRALLPYTTAASRHQSRAACVMVQAGAHYRLFSVA